VKRPLRKLDRRASSPGGQFPTTPLLRGYRNLDKLAISATAYNSGVQGGLCFEILAVEPEKIYERRGRIQRKSGHINKELFHHPDAVRIPESVFSGLVGAFRMAHAKFNYYGPTEYQREDIFRLRNELTATAEAASSSAFIGFRVKHTMCRASSRWPSRRYRRDSRCWSSAYRPRHWRSFREDPGKWRFMTLARRGVGHRQSGWVQAQMARHPLYAWLLSGPR
jgi:hypothetical protein